MLPDMYDCEWYFSEDGKAILVMAEDSETLVIDFYQEDQYENLENGIRLKPDYVIIHKMESIQSDTADLRGFNKMVEAINTTYNQYETAT